MDFETVKNNLKERGFAVSCFETGEDAASYLNEQIDDTTVGFGGSLTLHELGLFESLSAHNKVHSHWDKTDNGNAIKMAENAEVYISSVNGLAETGEIINIDGRGNRVAAIDHGHKMVYLVVGKNKIAETYEDALWRARNIASPKNAQRLCRKTPCAIKGDRCYDCNSPERICRILSVLWRKPSGCMCEVVLINRDLGY